MDSNIKTISLILVFWIVLSLFIAQLVSDPVVSSSGSIGDTNYTTGSTNVNVSDLRNDGSAGSSGGIQNALGMMFGFTMPSTLDMPQQIVTILSIFNWFLVLLSGILLYRIINPFA